MISSSKEPLKDNLEHFGGPTLRRTLAALLKEHTFQANKAHWNLEIIELEKEESSGSFGEDSIYRGEVTVKFSRAKSGDKKIEPEIVITLLSGNTLSFRQFETEDANDLFTDRYYYDVNQKRISELADTALQNLRYKEAGGEPFSKVWTVTPEQLQQHYPEYFGSPKVLIDGWAKSFDLSKVGASQELTSEEVQTMERVAATLSSLLIRTKNEGHQSIVAQAGNSAGIQKLIATTLEEAQCKLLFALPVSKDPEKYVNPTRTLVVQIPPVTGEESKWGDELMGKAGIASAEFSVRVVFLVGGGDNLEKQLAIYLDNILEAKKRDKMYVIAAIQGVGGMSSKEKLIPALKKYAQQDEYKSLFPHGSTLNESFLPDWLQLIQPENEVMMANKIEALLMRTHWSATD